MENNPIVKTFFRLVRLTSPSGSEEKVAKVLIKWLKNHHFKVEKDRIGNVFATFKGHGQPLLLCAHMDTVEEGKPIVPVVKNSVIRSASHTILGADNKATIAAMLTAVEEYLTANIKPRSLEMLFTVKEETGGGIEFFNHQKIKSPIGVIFDFAKPLGGIVLSSPFIINFKVEYFGKAAHAENPLIKSNALLPAVKFLTTIKPGKFDHNLTSINIGVIESGTKINVAPQGARISGEIRSFKKDLFYKRLKKVQAEAMKSIKNSDVEVKFTTDGFCPGYELKATDQGVKKIANILKNLKYPVQYYKSGNVSDSNILVDKGLKILTLTDGVTNNHSEKETITVQDLNKLAEIIRAMILNI